MPTKEETQSLAEEIVYSYEARVTGIGELRETVKSDLKKLHDSRVAMSQKLHADLAEVCGAVKEGEKKRRSEAREFMGELTRAVAEGKAAARARLKEFSDMQRVFRDDWQRITTMKKAKRGGQTVTVAPSPSVAEKAAELPPEPASLNEKVREYLAKHLDGTKMTELEQEFGLSRFQMTRVLKALMDEDKVEKRELLYFTI